MASFCFYRWILLSIFEQSPHRSVQTLTENMRCMHEHFCNIRLVIRTTRQIFSGGKKKDLTYREESTESKCEWVESVILGFSQGGTKSENEYLWDQKSSVRLRICRKVDRKIEEEGRSWERKSSPANGNKLEKRGVGFESCRSRGTTPALLLPLSFFPSLTPPISRKKRIWPTLHFTLISFSLISSSTFSFLSPFFMPRHYWMCSMWAKWKPNPSLFFFIRHAPNTEL